MKMISKIAGVALALVLGGSSVFAQSIDDAKKAIDAEQYSKAKSMLTNLTTTQPTKDENFFYLGWVYISQDYLDSAKASFTKGLAANPKSALNFVGLGVIAHLSKDAAGTNSNFTQASNFASKHDSKPYLYMGKGYLTLIPGTTVVTQADADAAIAVLNKGKLANPKDAEILVELGNADRATKNTSDAYTNYSAAETLDPKYPAAYVAQGVLISNAQNYEDAEKQYQSAIAIDPNYGPAYREWAESDLEWAKNTRSVASVKIKEAVDHYQKFLSLTDKSTESLLRYATFLYNAGDFVTLQEVSATLAKSANANARVYRFIAYSAYENKDYAAGLAAMNTWFQKAEPSRIASPDYLYLGKLEIASGKDTTKGIADLKKAAELDTMKTSDVYAEIAGIYRKKKEYLLAAQTYEEAINKQHGKPLLNDHVFEGVFYYISFNAKKPDSSLLVKADSAFSYSSRIAAKPIPDVIAYRARIATLKDGDMSKLQGLAKPYYEKLIAVVTAEPSIDAKGKRFLAEAYAYLGNYYVYHDKDDAKAMEAFTKVRENDPDNNQAKFYFDQKAAPAGPPAKAPAKKP